MSFFIKHIVLRHIRSLSVANILQHAHSYGFSIQPSEAKEIHHLLQTTDFDPLSKSDHVYLFQQLEEVTNPSTARKAEKLLYELMDQHGFTKHLYA